MGIAVEFCPDLCLRSLEDAVRKERKANECLPQVLDEGVTYDFLKEGQRNYWMLGEIPLRLTEGNGVLSRPVASVILSEVTHFLNEGKVWTRGKYTVKEVYGPNDKKIHFDGLEKIK
jgi:hypothetical protein